MTLACLNIIFNDAPQPWQLAFQDSATPGFTGIVELHNTIFFYLIVIFVSVFWVLGSIIYYYNSNSSPIVHKYLTHGKPFSNCLDSNPYSINLKNYFAYALKKRKRAAEI